MQYILFKRSLLYVILNFTLCYAMVAGCNRCRGRVNTLSNNRNTSESEKRPQENATIEKKKPGSQALESKYHPDENKEGKEKDGEEDNDDDEDDDDEEEDDDDDEEEDEEKEVEVILNHVENELQADIDPSKDSIERSNPLPSAPPYEAAWAHDYPHTPPPPYTLEPENDRYDPGYTSLHNAPKPIPSTPHKKPSGPLNRVLNFCKAILTKDRPILRDKIQKLKFKIKSFTKPIDALIKDRQALEDKRNRYQKLLEVRKKQKDCTGLLNEQDQELLALYKYTSDARINLKIQKLRLHIGVLNTVIKKKKQRNKKKEKKIYKYTQELEELDKRRKTYQDVQSIRKMHKTYLGALFDSRERKIIASCEHITEEYLENNIEKWKKLFEEYKSVSCEEIEKNIKDLDKKIKEAGIKLNKLKEKMHPVDDA